jgi:glycosyltransferase involved in cell wall biosynthesis
VTTSGGPLVLIYSTQSIYPYWGGSEKYWFEAVVSPRFQSAVRTHVTLRRSPTTEARGRDLKEAGASVSWWTGDQRSVSLAVRRRLAPSTGRARALTTSGRAWARLLGSVSPDLVWLNLASLGGIASVEDAARECRDREIPYWLVVQHAAEHWFAADDERTESVATILEGARRVVVVAERNREAIVQAIGRPLPNLWRSENTLSEEYVAAASRVANQAPPRTDGTARFLHLARIDPIVKGQHIALLSLSRREWRDRDWTLTLVGDGPHRSLLRRLALGYGIPDDRFHADGAVSDVLAAIAESDLLLMPSNTEGMPFALLEGMAAGRPAVGTPVGGVPEVISEGETGWLSASTEAAHVAAALERAWLGRADWPAVGRRAAELVRSRHVRGPVLEELLAALGEDLDSGRSSRRGTQLVGAGPDLSQ